MAQNSLWVVSEYFTPDLVQFVSHRSGNVVRTFDRKVADFNYLDRVCFAIWSCGLFDTFCEALTGSYDIINDIVCPN